jgi:3-methylcrotonyl-CoA carboxylase alpha subunit
VEVSGAQTIQPKKITLKRDDSAGDAAGTAGSVLTPMPGKVIKVFVAAGETVTKDQPLLIVEAMKMEHVIRAPLNGVLKDVFFKEVSI